MVDRPLSRPPLQPLARSPARSGATAERIERCWPDETVFCIASGPSLTREDVDAVRDRGRVIVINTTHELAPWADVLYADVKWWIQHPEGLEFQGERWAAAHGEVRAGVRMVRVTPESGLSRDPGFLRSGGHSGHQAINFAYLRGASRIVLLGYDMQHSGGRSHWHGDHPRPLSNPVSFRRWIEGMRRLALDLDAAGVECINCTRETALPFFRQLTLERVL